MKFTQKQLLVAILAFIIGIIVMYAFTRVEVQSNKEVTKRIIQTSINNIQAHQLLANSCSQAYVTITNCLSNISSCSLQEESKKLDIYELQKDKANEQIKIGNKKLEKILEDINQ